MADNTKIVNVLDKLENKLDALDTRLDSVDRTLVRQEANLGEHMRRTAIAEDNIKEIKNELEPVKRHVNYVEGALKGLGVLALVLSIVGGLFKLFS